MKYPTSVAVASSGCILVADGSNNRIIAVDPTPSSARDLPLPVAGGPQRPYGLVSGRGARQAVRRRVRGLSPAGV